MAKMNYWTFSMQPYLAQLKILKTTLKRLKNRTGKGPIELLRHLKARRFAKEVSVDPEIKPLFKPRF